MLAYEDRAGRAIRYRPRLKITERFLSLQGEGSHVGLPCTFIRLTGCALRCGYCDSAYAFYGGQWADFEELLVYVAEQGARLVQITGGEPLHQPAVWPFMARLVAAGYKPLLETSGAVSIAGLPEGVHTVLDLKTPESGESARMLWSNLEHLQASDEVKFVVCSQADLDWSLARIREHDLDRRFQVLISPIWSIADKGGLAQRVIDSGLAVRFQIQLHKLLWGDVPGK